MRRESWALLAAITLSLLIVASVGYEATMTKSVSQSSSLGNETTKSPTSTVSTSSQTGIFAATESNPTNGLQLIVTVEPTDVAPGQNVTISVSVFNSLVTTNNFTFAPGESPDSLTTVSLYYGRFTQSNISVAGPYVRFFQKPTGCPCAIVENPNEYTFPPHQGMNQTIIVGGYWTESDGNSKFNLFQAATYTVEAYDIWGQITLGYFTVSD
jgi:hypothetical protein